MKWFVTIFATGLGTGYLPIAPGTWGSVLGLGLWWLLSSLPYHIYIPTVVAFIFFSVWVSSQACTLFNDKDPSKVTIDEVAGLLVTFIFHQFSWITAIAGFILFRVFDIVKPWPIRLVERRLPAGWGVVMDDVLAGVYANVVLWIVIIVLGKFGIT